MHNYKWIFVNILFCGNKCFNTGCGAGPGAIECVHEKSNFIYGREERTLKQGETYKVSK